MEQEASVRVDIQKYEETLAKDPGSYCFAPLAELYRKLGLLDDAINIAKRGSDLHPEYIGGFMALGRACIEKGLQEEGRTALEKVVSIAPDNVLAQKLLSGIRVEPDNSLPAGELRSALSQNPVEAQSTVLHESLPPVSMAQQVKREPVEEFMEFDVAEETGSEEDDMLLDDVEVLEDLADEDLLDEDFIVSPPATEPVNAPTPAIEGKSPLSTTTMAELYVAQGFVKRALTIYRELVDADPDNPALKKRLYELKAAIDQDTASARYGAMAGAEAVQGSAEVSETEAGEILPAAIPAQDVVVETLEKWLHTIKRRR